MAIAISRRSRSSPSPSKIDADDNSRRFESSRVSLYKRQSSVGSMYQTTCISKHYALHQQIYDAFTFHYDNLGCNLGNSNNSNNNDDDGKSDFDLVAGAFCLGWKFVETALIQLPKHGYFYSNENPRFVEMRTKSSGQALEVTKRLKRILKLLDESATFRDGAAIASLLQQQDSDESGSCSSEEPTTATMEPSALLFAKHRNECREKLKTLKYLAKEQSERLETYEAKRERVESEWETKEASSREDDTAIEEECPRKEESSTTTTSLASSFCLLDDCDAVSASLLSCSSYFCPTALSTKPSNGDDETPGSQRQHQTDDTVVFGTVPWRTSTTTYQYHPPPSTTTTTTTTTLAPSSPPYLPPSCRPTKTSLIDDNDDDEDDRNEDIRDSNRTTQDSLRNPQRLADETRTVTKKQAGKRMPLQHLFQKKQNPRIIPSGGDQDLEEALFQSELEFAKAASMRDDDDGDESCGNSDLAVAALSPAGSCHDYDLQRAMYLSGLEVKTESCRSWGTEQQSHREACYQDEKRDDVAESPIPVVKGTPVGTTSTKHHLSSRRSSPDPPPGAIFRRKSSMFVSLETLKCFYHEDFNCLRDSGRVEVSYVPTHQGRISGSTNGCTVIAPLLCAHHFHSKDLKRIGGDSKGRSRKVAPVETTVATSISDQTIVDVIDIETPNILPTIRKNLGLSRHAFLIPHDAHESLIEMNRMSRDNFLTVCGGNILEDSHLGALVKELSTLRPKGKRLGATFFFHQHVIAILQLRRPGQDQLWFDIIDSLPQKSTLRREVSADDGNHYELSDGNPVDAVRIRCLDAVALKATLQWYACSVFTSENARYIDTYQWDEKLTDFDPRVFQAFLWTET